MSLLPKVIYANENDPSAAAWLSALPLTIDTIDDRSIADVDAKDLNGFSQCHFFAGIGGWLQALRLAGVPTTFSVWTGSCPCQHVSGAGKRDGAEDERHLWPEFYRLISECRPPIIFGEQTASGDGREWLDGVSLDLEEMDYAVASADLCAAGVGAPHIRQRLFWVAYAAEQGRCPWRGTSQDDGMVYAERPRLQEREQHGGIQDPTGPRATGKESQLSGDVERVDDTTSSRQQPEGEEPESQARDEARMRVPCERRGDNFWRDSEYLYCTDGKYRPVEPGTFPLAHGIPSRVAQLRGLGNAIVPQVAAEFIKAALIVH